MNIVKWPFGPATTVEPANSAAVTVEILNQRTFIKMATMAQATTLALTIDSEVTAGAEVFIEAGSDATARALTFGTGMEGAAQAGTISKANLIYAVYDRSAFQVVSARLLS